MAATTWIFGPSQLNRGHMCIGASDVCAGRTDSVALLIHAELCSGMNRWMLGRRAALLPNRPMAAPAKRLLRSAGRRCRRLSARLQNVLLPDHVRRGRAIAALASLADGMLPAGQGLDTKAPVDTSTSVVEGMRGKAWKYDKPEKVAARETPAGAAAACEPGPAPESSAGTPREDAPTGRDRNEGEGEGDGDGEGDVDGHGDEDDLIADFLLDVENSSDDSD